MLGERSETGAPLWRHLSKFSKTISKEYSATKQQQKLLQFQQFAFSRDQIQLFS